MLWEWGGHFIFYLIGRFQSFLSKLVELSSAFSKVTVIFHHRTEKIQYFIVGQVGLQFLNKHFEGANDQIFTLDWRLWPRVIRLDNRGILGLGIYFWPKPVKFIVNFLDKIVTTLKILFKRLFESGSL